MVPPEAEDDCCGEKNKKKTKAHNQRAFNDVADGQTDTVWCIVPFTREGFRLPLSAFWLRKTLFYNVCAS